MTKSKLLLAVAGSGKTESIIKRCVENSGRRLIITYTRHGQLEIENRLQKAFSENLIHQLPQVVGWYQFLIENFLKPYLPIFRQGQQYRGFSFDYSPTRYVKGDRKYFDGEGRVGRQTLGYVARMINQESQGMPIARLERIYEEIIIDEVQDLVASDLVIIERMLESSMQLYMVGDPRQIVYETSTSDRKYSNYRSVEKIAWYRERAAKSLLDIEEQSINYRSAHEVVDLANQVFDPDLDLRDATSGRIDSVEHQGIFRISESELAGYSAKFDPLALRWDKRSTSKLVSPIDWINFGDAKGMQADHVVIYPTKRTLEFLTERDPISNTISAAKHYVALTRARYSVAFILPIDAVAPGLCTWEARPS